MRAQTPRWLITPAGARASFDASRVSQLLGLLRCVALHHPGARGQAVRAPESQSAASLAAFQARRTVSLGPGRCPFSSARRRRARRGAVVLDRDACGVRSHRRITMLGADSHDVEASASRTHFIGVSAAQANVRLRSRALMTRTFLVGLTMLLASAAASAQGVVSRPHDIAGCYDLSPQVWSTDSGSSLTELDSLGRVRPSWSKVFVPHGFPSWRLHADTLVLIMTDGLSGWIVRLQRSGDTWSGVGVLTTDVVEENRAPPRQEFVLRRRLCPTPPNGGW